MAWLPHVCKPHVLHTVTHPRELAKQILAGMFTSLMHCIGTVHVTTHVLTHDLFTFVSGLTCCLWLQKRDTRVIVVTCGKHSDSDHWKGVDLADMHFTAGRQYDKMHAYAQSKAAGVLLAKQIASR